MLDQLRNANYIKALPFNIAIDALCYRAHYSSPFSSCRVSLPLPNLLAESRKEFLFRQPFRLITNLAISRRINLADVLNACSLPTMGTGPLVVLLAPMSMTIAPDAYL
jgi:hypothetical protein